MPATAFVDCHSHVVPSGDDGAKSAAEGRLLCRAAARRGTAVLYATPHVWPELPLTEPRERAIRDALAEIRPHAELDLRLGFELTPLAALLDEDPSRYVLEGTDAILVEVPFLGPLELLFALAENVEEAGLRPVIAHPERSEAVLDDERLVSELAERGWALQVNASSLLGRHGPRAQELGWRLVEGERASIVASDGHRETRPPHLDTAFGEVVKRLDWARASALFDGSALGVITVEPSRRRAASTGA